MSDSPITTLDTRSTFHMARLADGVLHVGFPDYATEVSITLDDLERVSLIHTSAAAAHCDVELQEHYDAGHRDGYQEAENDAETSAKARVMEQWHNDHHDGTVRFCYEQPCRDLREVVEG